MNGRHLLLIVCLFAATVSGLAGCGYTLKKPPLFETVRLGRFENRTFEPALQDRFCEALTHALMKNGIRVNSGADYEIHGSMNRLNVRSVAEQDDVAVQYEVTIMGSFFLTGPDGDTRELSGSGKFIVSFPGQGALEEVVAKKEGAIMEALENISAEIVDSIVNE
jgi:hypothetical protein